MANKPVKMAYKCFEPAGGADDTLCPVIFLHGFNTTKENWMDIPQVIADKTKRKALALDARNHGESEFTDVYITYNLLAIDLMHFMNTMNIPKVVLIGASMGARTAFTVALKNPKKVEMIFAGDMPVSELPRDMVDMLIEQTKEWITAVDAIPPGLSEKEAEKFVIDWYKNTLQKKFEEIPKFVRLHPKPDGTYDVCFNKDSNLNALNNYYKSFEALSGQYDGPAYFIYGSDSPMNVKKDEENIKRLFTKAELIEFKGATHDVHFDCSVHQKFIDVVLSVLNCKQ